MAYLHDTGWITPSESKFKSLTTIDEETLELFKSAIARKARIYERYYVAESDK